jgi:integrase
MAANTGAGLKGIRDRALLLLGFAGAFRRSELVALNVEDIEETPDGMKITIRRSKTDQEGEGQKVGIPRGKHAATCPVRALTAWLRAKNKERPATVLHLGAITNVWTLA